MDVDMVDTRRRVEEVEVQARKRLRIIVAWYRRKVKEAGRNGGIKEKQLIILAFRDKYYLVLVVKSSSRTPHSLG